MTAGQVVWWALFWNCHLSFVIVLYSLCNNMPLLPNNMPLSGNKDGLLSMQKYLYIFIEKNAEMFGGFADFLYLCNVVQERITTGGKGHPM